MDITSIAIGHPDGKPLSPKTVRHIANVIHGTFECAVIWELIERNPMTGVELPLLAPKEPKAIEKVDVSRLLGHARAMRVYPVIVLGLATGARRGELLALQWPDIDFETGIMNVTKSIEQTRTGLRVKSTKSKKPRRFMVPPGALDVLRERRTEQNRDRAMYSESYQDEQLIFASLKDRATARTASASGSQS